MGLIFTHKCQNQQFFKKCSGEEKTHLAQGDIFKLPVQSCITDLGFLEYEEILYLLLKRITISDAHKNRDFQLT